MWVKLDDGFVDHPKIARVGAVGAWLQLQALCYANRNLTDGFVPWGVARSFVARGQDYTDEADRCWSLALTCGMQGRDLEEMDWPAVLVAAGIWELVPGGYQIHDYKDYQPTKVQVLAHRRKHAARQQKYVQRKADAITDGVSDGVTDASPVPVPVPVPQRQRSLSLRERARASRATTLPEDFQLTEKLRKYAQSGGLDPESEFAHFRNHHLAKGDRMVRWDRAFMVWCQRADQFPRRA